MYESVKDAGDNQASANTNDNSSDGFRCYTPLALATGPGSNGHSQIGWVIVGGMFFGTFFSLVVVPVAYYIFAPVDYKKRQILRERKAKKNINNNLFLT